MVAALQRRLRQQLRDVPRGQVGERAAKRVGQRIEHIREVLQRGVDRWPIGRLVLRVEPHREQRVLIAVAAQ
jgi:hypothetical protein